MVQGLRDPADPPFREVLPLYQCGGAQLPAGIHGRDERRLRAAPSVRACGPRVQERRYGEPPERERRSNGGCSVMDPPPTGGRECPLWRADKDERPAALRARCNKQDKGVSAFAGVPIRKAER